MASKQILSPAVTALSTPEYNTRLAFYRNILYCNENESSLSNCDSVSRSTCYNLYAGVRCLNGKNLTTSLRSGDLPFPTI